MTKLRTERKLRECEDKMTTEGGYCTHKLFWLTYQPGSASVVESAVQYSKILPRKYQLHTNDGDTLEVRAGSQGGHVLRISDKLGIVVRDNGRRDEVVSGAGVSIA